MRIFIICSKSFYSKIPKIQKTLEESGHIVTLPNSYANPTQEDIYRKKGHKIHSEWKDKMFKKSLDIIKKTDAVLVLNFEKNGVKNYIGGATFLEMYDAFKLSKKIFLFNKIPQGILKDEIVGFNPIILNSDLTKLTS